MDLAEGHIAAMRKILGVGGVGTTRLGWRAYNLGLGHGYSVLEIVSCSQSVSGRPIATHFAARRDGDVAACYSNCSLAAKELGWTAKYDLQNMCEFVFESNRGGGGGGVG